MHKMFTLHSISHQQETPESGFITWHVSDERKRARKVVGITQLSDRGFIKTVLPHYPREQPLIELLSQYGEGDTFAVDFSLFNQTFGYSPREVHSQTQAELPAGNWLQNYWRRLFKTPFPVAETGSRLRK